MKNSRLILCSIFVLIFFGNTIFAQGKVKDGAILYLVRLQDGTVANEKNTTPSIAEALTRNIKNQKEENKAIIEAFETSFARKHFYFFNSSDSNQILKGNFEGFVFNSKKEKTISLPKASIIYVIDFGYGYPKGENQRYNNKGFVLSQLDNGKLTNTGIYGRAPYSGPLNIGKNRDYKGGIKRLLKRI